MVLWFYGFMKTTLDVPDDLYALVKARAALEGRTLRSVVEELLKGWVGSPPSGPTATKDAPPTLLAEPRVGYGKGRKPKNAPPEMPWDKLRQKWELENNPHAPVSSIAGTIKKGDEDPLHAHREHLRDRMRHPRSLDEIAGVLTDSGPDLDMARIREIYQQRLSEEWKRRHG